MDKQENAEWKIVTIKDRPSNFTIHARDQYTSLSYDFALPGFEISIELGRYSEYYLFNLIVPVIVMSMIGFFAEILPASSSDKINLAVTVLLGFMFLQTMISSLIPKSSSIPSISCYLLAALLLSAFNVASSTLVFSLNKVTAIKNGPRILNFVIRLMGIMVCYKIKWNLKMLKESKHRNPTNNSAQGYMPPPDNMSAPTDIASCPADIKGSPTRIKGELMEIEVHHEDPQFLDGEDIVIILNRLCSILYTIGSSLIIYIYLAPLILSWARN